MIRSLLAGVHWLSFQRDHRKCYCINQVNSYLWIFFRYFASFVSSLFFLKKSCPSDIVKNQMLSKLKHFISFSQNVPSLGSQKHSKRLVKCFNFYFK